MNLGDHLALPPYANSCKTRPGEGQQPILIRGHRTARMRTQVSPLPLDDVLFPLDDIFSKHIECLSRGWGWGCLGREGQASYELPHGGMGTQLLLPPWAAPAGSFPDLG